MAIAVAQTAGWISINELKTTTDFENVVRVSSVSILGIAVMGLFFFKFLIVCHNMLFYYFTSA